AQAAAASHQPVSRLRRARGARRVLVLGGGSELPRQRGAAGGCGPNANEVFPSKYFEAADLKGQGAGPIIPRGNDQPVGQQKQMKMVIYFRGHEKGLVCNKTNCSRIIQIAGSAMTEEWVGVQIKLYSTEVEFQGQVMDGIRIRPPKASKTNPLRPAQQK